MTQRLTQVPSSLVDAGKIVLAPVEIFKKTMLSETPHINNNNNNSNNNKNNNNITQKFMMCT